MCLCADGCKITLAVFVRVVGEGSLRVCVMDCVSLRGCHCLAVRRRHF